MGARRRREDIEYARTLGWVFDGYTGSGHLRYRHPDTQVKAIFSATTSDQRAIRNSRAFIRRTTPPREKS